MFLNGELFFDISKVSIVFMTCWGCWEMLSPDLHSSGSVGLVRPTFSPSGPLGTSFGPKQNFDTFWIAPPFVRLFSKWGVTLKMFGISKNCKMCDENLHLSRSLVSTRPNVHMYHPACGRFGFASASSIGMYDGVRVVPHYFECSFVCHFELRLAVH